MGVKRKSTGQPTSKSMAYDDISGARCSLMLTRVVGP